MQINRSNTINPTIYAFKKKSSQVSLYLWEKVTYQLLELTSRTKSKKKKTAEERKKKLKTQNMYIAQLDPINIFFPVTM